MTNSLYLDHNLTSFSVAVQHAQKSTENPCTCTKPSKMIRLIRRCFLAALLLCGTVLAQLKRLIGPYVVRVRV